MLTAEQQRQACLPIQMSCDGASLSEQSVSRVKLRRKEHVQRPHRDMLGVVTRRAFCAITIKGRAVLADVVTGTLYDAISGACLGSQQMRIVVEAAEPVPRRKRKAASEAAGWMNDTRRTA